MSASLADQIKEAELHALALDDFVERFSGDRKRENDVVRKREKARVAWAIVDTLKRLASTNSQGVLL